MTTGNEGQKPNPPIALQATPADIDRWDINEPVAAITSPASYTLESAFTRVSDEEKGETEEAQSKRRAFSMLSAVMSMYMRGSNTKEPFGAKIVLSNGNRSAAPEDFRGTPNAAIARAAERATNPVVRARLGDVAWLIDRKRSDMARIAIKAYVEMVDQLASGKLVSEYAPAGSGVNCSEATDALARALAIGKQIGLDKEEVADARARIVGLRQSAIPAGQWGTFRTATELDLKYGISDPAVIAVSVEKSIKADTEEFLQQSGWRLAARAYGATGNKDDANRCLIAVADSFVRQADVQKQSAMHASHWLAMAIAQLHGLPGVKERRAQLRHRLIDVQAGIPDEMMSFSTPFDVNEIVDHVKKGIDGLGLKELLFYFAGMGQIPDPDKLVSEARDSIAQFPLSSLFGSSHHDHTGKVLYRSEGSDLGNSDDSSAIAVKIAQSEGIRRHIYSIEIDVIRRHLNTFFYPSRDIFESLLRHSEFVPNELVHTYSRGLARFIEGDFVSALYVLTPLLEASLRHVLRERGYDVTKFDDATQTQQDLTISALFEQKRAELDDVFGRALTTDIERTFLDHPGPRIRHNVAHGLLLDGSPYGPDAQYACWLMFRLCLIPLFRFRGEVSLEE